MTISADIKNLKFPGNFFKDGQDKSLDAAYRAVIKFNDGNFDIEHGVATPEILPDLAEGANKTTIVKFLEANEIVSVHCFTAEIVALLVALRNDGETFKLPGSIIRAIADIMGRIAPTYIYLPLFKDQERAMTAYTALIDVFSDRKENNVSIDSFFHSTVSMFLLLNNGATDADFQALIAETAN